MKTTLPYTLSSSYTQKTTSCMMESHFLKLRPAQILDINHRHENGELFYIYTENGYVDIATYLKNKETL